MFERPRICYYSVAGWILRLSFPEARVHIIQSNTPGNHYETTTGRIRVNNQLTLKHGAWIFPGGSNIMTRAFKNQRRRWVGESERWGWRGQGWEGRRQRDLELFAAGFKYGERWPGTKTWPLGAENNPCLPVCKEIWTSVLWLHGRKCSQWPEWASKWTLPGASRRTSWLWPWETQSREPRAASPVFWPTEP